MNRLVLVTLLVISLGWVAGCSQKMEPAGHNGSSTYESNKQLIRTWAAEFNKGNVVSFDKLIHEDFVDHNPFPGAPPTKAGYIATLKQVQTEGFPGIQVELVELLSDGDKIAFRVNATAKHVGTVMGAPGTGKEIKWVGYGIYRIKDNQLIERWELLDSLSFMMQLGLAKMVQP